MSKNDRYRAYYLHAWLKRVNRDVITNSSLREIFKIDSKNSSMISRLLTETCAVELVKISPDSTSDKNRKYLPFERKVYLTGTWLEWTKTSKNDLFISFFCLFYLTSTWLYLNSNKAESVSLGFIIPTYIPTGYVLDEEISFIDKNGITLRYVNNDKIIYFEYNNVDSANSIQIDTENGYRCQDIVINGNPACVYLKDYAPNEMKNIVWQIDDYILYIRSNAELDILIKFAEGISENEGKAK